MSKTLFTRFVAFSKNFGVNLRNYFSNYMIEFEIIAKTFQGLESVLAQEITELGGNNIQMGHRMVTFTGDKELLYRANFCLRTAVRVLKPIKYFQAADADDVYNAVKSIEWDEYLNLSTSFSVDSVINSEEFRHSKFVAYKVKDAIVDYFREKTGQRPNISVTNADLKLNIHITDQQCTLSLDSSGESLHQRGYRVASVEAPINEVLAAGLIKLTGWKYDCDFVDPFCGSGTILVEAALMARNIYPGIFRKKFGFEGWKDFDRDLLDRIYNDDSEERDFNFKCYGYDINKPAIEAALANAKSAGVANEIVLEQRDVRHFEKPSQRAIMVTNPPYGKRLQTPDILNLYKTIGERLKHGFQGGDAWIICSSEECFNNIGLKPSLRYELQNGSLDCDFRKYQIFDGSFQELRATGKHVKTEEEKKLMGEKNRFRQNREDFKRRHDDMPDGEYADQDFVDENPQYIALRNRHRDFNRQQTGFERRQNKKLREASDEGREFFNRNGDRNERGGHNKSGFGHESRNDSRDFRKDGRGPKKEGRDFKKDSRDFKKEGRDHRKDGGNKRNFREQHGEMRFANESDYAHKPSNKRSNKR